MSKLAIKLLLISTLCGIAYSKNFSRCEFVKELFKAGINDRDRIEDHVCAAFGSSTERSSNEYSEQNGGMYGMYIIYKTYWCDKGPDTGCGIPCEKLKDDDVQDDIKCASKILRQDGTKAFSNTNLCNFDIKNLIKQCIDNLYEELEKVCTSMMFSNMNNFKPMVSSG
jgi:hypothetical protein